jgi:predicted dinucleotide-binding enzyme
MKIGVIGAGRIGSALAGHFHKLRHFVQVANSRGPETLLEVARKTGATPVSFLTVAKEVDLVVLTIPMHRVPLLPQDLFHGLPAGTPIIDTGNYIPELTGTIDKIEQGLPESEWTSKVLGRPVIKVFNNIAAHSLNYGGVPKGERDRIALPVSGDDTKSKRLVLELLDDMGFDGLDVGRLPESWRQQPGTPAYGTDHCLGLLRSDIAHADRETAPKMRDALYQKLFSLPPNSAPQAVVLLARALWTEVETG